MDEGALSRWVQAQLRALADGTTKFVVNHLDEIDPSFSHGTADIPAILDALRAASSLVSEAGGRSIARLAIPLEISSDLDVRLPDLQTLRLTAEPPSIYVFTPEHLIQPSDREEYRCPMVETPWGAGLNVEYACGRSLHEREQGWEFTRTLWVGTEILPTH